MARGYSILLLAIVASVVVGKPQTVDPSLATAAGPATQDGPGTGAPTDEVMTCDCLNQINTDVMPDVNTAINELSKAVEDLFTLAKRTDISPVAVRHFCFFCGKIRKYGRRVRGWHFKKHHYHHCDHHKCYHCHQWHCPHCCNHHRWKRQADGQQPAALPVCPINEVVATAQSAREGTQLVNEVLAGVRADPAEVSQELLDDVTALYNDVNESVRNLQTATDPNSSDCADTQAASGDVVFPGERQNN